jgi:hypothetical protein
VIVCHSIKELTVMAVRITVIALHIVMIASKLSDAELAVMAEECSDTVRLIVMEVNYERSNYSAE